jgi:hypothetical protein
MSYDYFLLYLSAFIALGMVLGLIAMSLARKNRIALRSLLSPLLYRRGQPLVKPIPLGRAATSSSPKAQSK